MSVDIVIAGTGCRMVLSLLGREREEPPHPRTADWLNAELVIVAGPYRVQQRVTTAIDELTDFRNALVGVLEAGAGSAGLSNLDGEYAAGVTVSDSKAEFRISARKYFSRRAHADLKIEHIATTLDALERILADVRKALVVFPDRAWPEDKPP